jgi:hypothetical protein
MNKKKLSILIPTVNGREEYLKRLLKVLEPQKTSEVEILIEKDNKKLSIGEKRNILVSKASGDYIAFVDDDDLVSSTYISSILNALKTEPDCVGMHLLHYHDGVLRGLTYHSLEYTHWFERFEYVIELMHYYRNPNHLNPIKREIALKCPFPSISMGEDKSYSQQTLQYLKTEVKIVEPIYYYLFRSIK